MDGAACSRLKMAYRHDGGSRIAAGDVDIVVEKRFADAGHGSIRNLLGLRFRTVGVNAVAPHAQRLTDLRRVAGDGPQFTIAFEGRLAEVVGTRDHDRPVVTDTAVDRLGTDHRKLL